MGAENWDRVDQGGGQAAENQGFNWGNPFGSPDTFEEVPLSPPATCHSCFCHLWLTSVPAPPTVADVFAVHGESEAGWQGEHRGGGMGCRVAVWQIESWMQMKTVQRIFLLQAELELSFRDAVEGCIKRLNIPSSQTCSTCREC